MTDTVVVVERPDPEVIEVKARGPQGLPGLPGDDGLDGVDGVDGAPGPKGDQGIQGPKGDQGIQGPKGDQGEQGPKGDTGAQGIQGVKGDAGKDVDPATVAKLEAELADLRASKAADLMLPGDFLPTGTWQGVTFAVVAGRTYYMRYVPPKDRLITKLAFGVTLAAGANDKVESSFLDKTGVRVLSSGQKEGLLNGATGIKTIVFPEAIPVKRGVVCFFSMSFVTPFGGAAAQVLGMANNNGLASDLMGTAAMETRISPIATAFPTPAGPPALGATSTTPPFVAVIE